MLEYVKNLLLTSDDIDDVPKALDSNALNINTKELFEISEFMHKIDGFDDKLDHLMTVNRKFIPITHEELYYGVDDLIELSALCSPETFKYFCSINRVTPDEVISENALYVYAALGGNHEIFHILEQKLPTDLHEVYKCLMPYYVLEQFLIMALPQCREVVEPAMNMLCEFMSYCNNGVLASELPEAKYCSGYIRETTIAAMYACMSKQNFLKTFANGVWNYAYEDVVSILLNVDAKWFEKDELHSIFMDSVVFAYSMYDTIDTCKPLMQIVKQFMMKDCSYQEYEHIMTEFIYKYALTEIDLQWLVDTINESLDYFAYIFDFTHFKRYCNTHNFIKLMKSTSYKHLAQYNGLL